MGAARRSRNRNILVRIMTAILKFNDAVAYGLAAYSIQQAVENGASVDAFFDHSAQTISVPDHHTGTVRQVLIRSKIEEEEYDLEYL